MFMSMVDMNFNPRVPAAEVINVRTTCTNRDLPAKLPFGGREGDFEVEGTALLSRVHCLTKPTETIRPPQRRAAQWRLDFASEFKLFVARRKRKRDARSTAGNFTAL